MWRWRAREKEREKMCEGCRCEDVKIKRCEDVSVCEGKKMWRCEFVNMWVCEHVRMWRLEHVKMYSMPPLLEEPFAQTFSDKVKPSVYKRFGCFFPDFVTFHCPFQIPFKQTSKSYFFLLWRRRPVLEQVLDVFFRFWRFPFSFPNFFSKNIKITLFFRLWHRK